MTSRYFPQAFYFPGTCVTVVSVRCGTRTGSWDGVLLWWWCWSWEEPRAAEATSSCGPPPSFDLRIPLNSLHSTSKNLHLTPLDFINLPLYFTRPHNTSTSPFDLTLPPPQYTPFQSKVEHSYGVQNLTSCCCCCLKIYEDIVGS